MIRRLNFTGRKKIPRSRVRIVVHGDDLRRTFDAELKLDGLELPAVAAVYVEAYHRSAYRRYDFGTVGRLGPPADRSLDGLPVASPLFRVKVVRQGRSIGRILAAAERVVPERADREDEQRQSLLPVEYQDLGERIWALDLEADWPRLILNERFAGIRDFARSGPEFLTLVYPEILRTILTRIVRDPDLDPDGDEDDWSTLWIRFVRRELGRPRPPRSWEDGDPAAWVDDAVTAFCVRKHVVVEFERFLAGRGA
jgi:hypothetical protein